jgi:luciferase-like monooxygenase
MRRVETWGGLCRADPGCGVGQALWAGDCEIIHFHTDDSADIHLSAGVVRWLREGLEKSPSAYLHPNSPWATLRLDNKAGVELMATLISVALRAHTHPHDHPAQADRCNVGRMPADRP